MQTVMHEALPLGTKGKKCPNTKPRTCPISLPGSLTRALDSDALLEVTGDHVEVSEVLNPTADWSLPTDQPATYEELLKFVAVASCSLKNMGMSGGVA